MIDDQLVVTFERVRDELLNSEVLREPVPQTGAQGDGRDLRERAARTRRRWMVELGVREDIRAGFLRTVWRISMFSFSVY